MNSRPVRWGHALEEKPEKWEGSFLTKDEAVSAGRNTYADGEIFYVCSGELAWGPKYMLDADAVETCLWDAAYSEVGEAAEGFPDLTEAAKRELTQLLDIWATKHVKANFWIANPKTTQRIEPRTQQRLRAAPS
jgi:hypothetical protein